MCNLPWWRRLIVLLGLIASCLPLASTAQQAGSARDEELLRYADGLRRLGLVDYAEIVVARAGKGAQTDRLKLEILVARGKWDDAKTLIDRRSDPNSVETWELKFVVADGYFAWGKYDETRAIYDGFFKAVTNPTDGMKKLYESAAYKYAQMLLLINQKTAAVNSYSNALRVATEQNVIRQVKGEMGEVLLKMAQEEPDPAKREALLKRVEAAASDILWIPDLWFGKGIVMLAHAKVLRGDFAGAEKLVDQYKEQLLGIDTELKRMADAGGENLTRLSPMAQCRYLLAVIMQEQAEKILKAGGDKTKALELLAGREEGGKRQPGAIQHFVNVFLRYPSTPWAAESGARARHIQQLLKDEFGKSAEFNPTPEQWAAVEAAQQMSAQTLFNERKFEAAADEYVRILNVFPETESALQALNNLCRCYIELGNDIYAETILRYLAERFSAKKDMMTKAGNIVLGIGDFYAERQKPQLKNDAYNLFFQHFPQHIRTPGLLGRFAQERLAADDPDAAIGYYQRIEQSFSNSPAYLAALSGLGYCYAKTGDRTNEVRTLSKLLAELQKQKRPGQLLVGTTYRLASALRLLDPKYLINAINRYDEVVKMLSGDRSAYQSSAEEAKSNQLHLERAMYYKGICLAALPPPEGQSPTVYKEMAIKTLEAFVGQFPKSELAPAALSQIGTLWTLLQKPEDARRTFNLLQTQYPDSPEARNANFLLGINLIKMNEPQRARDVFKEMFSGKGTFPDAQILTAGRELLNAGEYQIALDAFTRVLSSGKRERALREPALYGQGEALVALGQRQEGIKVLEGLLDEYKNSGLTVEVALTLSRAYRFLGAEEPDVAKRNALFDKSVLWMKTVRRYVKEPAQLAESDMAVARIYVAQAKAAADFGVEQEVGKYRKAAIAAFQILIMTGDRTNAKVIPFIEEAYYECMPLLLDEEKWQDVVDDCSAYIKSFPTGKHLPDIGAWLNRAKSKLATVSP